MTLEINAVGVASMPLLHVLAVPPASVWPSTLPAELGVS
jgi:hypothetical protein